MTACCASSASVSAASAGSCDRSAVSRAVRSSPSTSRSWSRAALISVQRSLAIRMGARSVRLQHFMQQQARLLPVALHGALRDAPHACDLVEAKAAEELQVDQ